MKHYKKIHLGILCLFVSLAMLSAQQDDFFAFHESTESTEITENKAFFYPKKTPKYYRHHKKLPLTYSGIVLELTTSELPLKRDHKLFTQFGNVYYDQLEDGEYVYCILTSFKDLKKAKHYLQTMITPRAPTAKVVKYQLGRRKKVR